MPLLIRIMTGLVAGGLLFLAATTEHTVLYAVVAVIWVFAGLTFADAWEDIE